MATAGGTAIAGHSNGLNTHDGFLDALIQATSVREVEGLLTDAFRLSLGRDVEVDLTGVALPHAKKWVAEAKHWADLNKDNTTLTSFTAVDFSQEQDLDAQSKQAYAVANPDGRVRFNREIFSAADPAKAVRAHHHDHDSGHSAGSKQRGVGATAAHELWHHTYYNAVKNNELAPIARKDAPATHMKQDVGFKERPKNLHTVNGNLGGVSNETAKNNISKYAGTNGIEAHAEAGTKATEMGYRSDFATKAILRDAPGPTLHALATTAPAFNAAMARLDALVDAKTGLPVVPRTQKHHMSVAATGLGARLGAEHRASLTNAPALKAHVHRPLNLSVTQQSTPQRPVRGREDVAREPVTGRF
jgi:hypothetical protein